MACKVCVNTEALHENISVVVFCKTLTRNWAHFREYGGGGAVSPEREDRIY